MHLTRIDASVSLRPSLGHLDALEKHMKHAKSMAEAATDESGSEMEDKPAPAVVKKQSLQVHQIEAP